MTRPQVKVSAEETRLFGLFRWVTGKVSSQYTWVEAKTEGIIESEKKRCEELLEQEFEKLRNDPARSHETHFSIELSDIKGGK